MAFRFNPLSGAFDIVDGNSITSVSNSDGTLTISPTTGAVVASINLAHENTWTVGQVFNDADVTVTPIAPASGSMNFTSDPGGFFANGTYYQYYVYSYYYDGVSYAYDPVGIFIAGTDPNDGGSYKIDLAWDAGTDANGYLLLDFTTGYWLDVGPSTSYSVDTSTSWNISALPSLTPNSLLILGHPLWANKNLDWGITDFNVLAAGISGTNHLQFRWKATGGSGAGALRFESDDGTLRQINSNVYGDIIVGTSAITGGNITGNIYPSGISATYIPYASGGGALTYSGGLKYDASTGYMWLSGGTGTAASNLHIHRPAVNAADLRFTNTTTGATSSDGFQIGITSAGVAELRQRENLAAELYTNNTKRLEVLAGGNVGIGTAGTVNAKVDILATTEQLRLLYDSSNSVQFTVSSAGLLSLQTTAGATAGVYTLTPHGAGGDGTNRTLSFGTAWGNAALFLYNNGAGARFGWGMRADCMQFFAPTTTGGLYTWNRGGDLQATGTNEIMRLVQYASGTGAGLGMGRGAFGGTTPYRIDLEGVSAGIGTAGTENIIRFSRPISGGVSYPEAFAIGIGRYSSSGFGPDTRIDFLLKSTANSDIVPNALVMSLQSNLKMMLYGEIEIDGDLNHDGTNVGFYAVAPVARATTAGAASTFAANTSGIANDSATFDGYTIGQVVKALRNIGVLT